MRRSTVFTSVGSVTHIYARQMMSHCRKCDTRLLPNSSTCKFHPCCLYCQIAVPANSTPVAFCCQFPVLAISTLAAFTVIFQYLQIPTLLLYLQFPLLANSSPTKCITFNFHPVAFTVIFQYLQFPPPLLPNSITCKFSAPTEVTKSLSTAHSNGSDLIG